MAFGTRLVLDVKNFLHGSTLVAARHSERALWWGCYRLAGTSGSVSILPRLPRLDRQIASCNQWRLSLW